ncbi:MAG: hypothetical protein KFF50_09965 [Desulfatitalea sp.]|jgi:hypothetical protein|nr:hypothetical protein [Desulfatitalea sp.]
MAAEPLVVRLNEGRAEVRNGHHTFQVTGRNAAESGYGCPTELVAAALGS